MRGWGGRIARCAGGRFARQAPQQIVDRGAWRLEEGARFQVLAPVIRGRKGEYTELLRELQVKGYSRARVDGTVIRLDSVAQRRGRELPALTKYEKHTIEVVVDRLAVKADAQAAADGLGGDGAGPVGWGGAAGLRGLG